MRLDKKKASLRLRVGAILTVIGSLFTILGPAPASAASTWHCNFGPETNPANAAYFTFVSRPGYLDDTLSIRGGGWCDRTLSPPCPVGIICDIVGESVRATIYTDAVETNHAASLSFGRCDTDAEDAQDNGRLVLYGVELFIRMGSRGYLWKLIIDPAVTGPNPVFPGLGAQHGGLYNSNLDRIGSVSFRTRIGGQCPPAGTFRAYFDDVTFTG